MGCVYLITNTVNGRKYVGKTCSDLESRMQEHKWYAANRDSVLARAIRKHGFKNFSWRVLFRSDVESDLFEREVLEISKRKTRAPNGYNMTDGGEGTTGFSLNEESRKKMSASLTGKKHSAETIEKRRLHHVGRKRSEETKKRISESKKGHGKGIPISDSLRKTISECNRRRTWTDESRARLSASMLIVQKRKRGELCDL